MRLHLRPTGALRPAHSHASTAPVASGGGARPPGAVLQRARGLRGQPRPKWMNYRVVGRRLKALPPTSVIHGVLRAATTKSEALEDLAKRWRKRELSPEEKSVAFSLAKLLRSKRDGAYRNKSERKPNFRPGAGGLPKRSHLRDRVESVDDADYRFYTPNAHDPVPNFLNAGNRVAVPGGFATEDGMDYYNDGTHDWTKVPIPGSHVTYLKKGRPSALGMAAPTGNWKNGLPREKRKNPVNDWGQVPTMGVPLTDPTGPRNNEAMKLFTGDTATRARTALGLPHTANSEIFHAVANRWNGGEFGNVAATSKHANTEQEALEDGLDGAKRGKLRLKHTLYRHDSDDYAAAKWARFKVVDPEVLRGDNKPVKIFDHTIYGDRGPIDRKEAALRYHGMMNVVKAWRARTDVTADRTSPGFTSLASTLRGQNYDDAGLRGLGIIP